MSSSVSRQLSLALVTSTDFAELHPDDAFLTAALRARGIEPVACVWSDPQVDWASFDALLIRTTWDYFQRHAEFMDWLTRIAELGVTIFNDIPLLRWNSDKAYLLELAAKGVEIIPTQIVAGRELGRVVATMRGEIVIKPTVSGGAWHTLRGCAGDLRSMTLWPRFPRNSTT
jgi:glutathione synthase/RimK-type ligase-like ATP-grasp enzyme